MSNISSRIKNDLDRERYIYNLEILDYIDRLVTKKPYLRFGQVISNLGLLKDETKTFYQEPKLMFKEIIDKFGEVE